MQLMIDKAEQEEQRFNKKALREHGKKLTLFPSLEEDWFKEINDYKRSEVSIEHYTISSGIDVMIEGSTIGKRFKHIFASGFVYNHHGVAVFPARSVNYTTKVQYLFRINKGINNSWDNSEINKSTPEEKRPIPFSRLIYIGDGENDIPAMKMVNYKGGYTIAVYPPKEGRQTKEESSKKRMVKNIKKDNRCQFISEANYSKDQTLYKIVTSLIDRIVNEHKHSMNLDAK